MFYAPPFETRGKFFGITKNCQFLGQRQLNEDDLKQLRKIYPNFLYKNLDKWVRRVSPTSLDEWDRKYIKTMSQTEYGLVLQPKSDITGFEISNPIYEEWFRTSYTIFDEPSVINIPEPIIPCEKLFDKNVLPIKN